MKFRLAFFLLAMPAGASAQTVTECKPLDYANPSNGTRCETRRPAPPTQINPNGFWDGYKEGNAIGSMLAERAARQRADAPPPLPTPSHSLGAYVVPVGAESVAGGYTGGLLITGFQPNSAGAAAGLMPADIIVSIDGLAVTSVDTSASYLADAGMVAIVGVLRHGQQQNVRVNFQAAPGAL